MTSGQPYDGPVIQTLDFRAHADAPRNVIPRASVDVASAEAAVAEVIAEVRVNGEQAALRSANDSTECVQPALRVPASVIDDAHRNLDPGVIASLEEAIRRVRIAHGDQLPMPRTTELAPGATVSQRWVPVDRVGLYVPGGRAVYPSSVVMNVVPAQLAGVGQSPSHLRRNPDFGDGPTRRSLPRRSCLASKRSMRWAERRRSRGSPTGLAIRYRLTRSAIVRRFRS